MKKSNKIIAGTQLNNFSDIEHGSSPHCWGTNIIGKEAINILTNNPYLKRIEKCADVSIKLTFPGGGFIVRVKLESVPPSSIKIDISPLIKKTPKKSAPKKPKRTAPKKPSLKKSIQK